MSFEFFHTSGTPVLLVNYFQFLSFLLLSVSCICMIRIFGKRKMKSGAPIPLFLNSTIVFIFHLVICGYGFQYSLLFETVPSENVFAQIGMLTWLSVTPILYFIVAALFARLCFSLWKERAGAEE